MPELNKYKPKFESFEPRGPVQETEPGQLTEQRQEKPAEKPIEKKPKRSIARSVARHQAQVAIPPTSDPDIKTIENILAEGMDKLFLSLSPQKQLDFKTSGEATAIKIKKVLQKKVARVKDIARLIVAWLKTLPGINKFFIEQEAKIKADDIMSRFRK